MRPSILKTYQPAELQSGRSKKYVMIMSNVTCALLGDVERNAMVSYHSSAML
jgi:hypothetical protein